MGCALAVIRAWRSVPATRSFAFVEGRTVRVVDVRSDGSVEVDDDGIQLRLLGVEYPLDTRAVDWLNERTSGRDVTLRFDRERLDRDGRVAAFVELDGTDLNLEVVRLGLAAVDRPTPFSASRKRAMTKAEAAAREAGRGRWASR